MMLYETFWNLYIKIYKILSTKKIHVLTNFNIPGKIMFDTYGC